MVLVCFTKHVCTVALATCPHPEGLRLEGVEATVDCPGPYIGHGYATIFYVSISQGGCLGVFPGARDIVWPCEGTYASSWQHGPAPIHSGLPWILPPGRGLT